MKRFIIIILTLIIILPSCSTGKKMQQPCGISVGQLKNKARIKAQVKSPYKMGKVYKQSSRVGKRTFMW